MALPPFRDLSPRENVKGGSPRTPSVGIPVAQYQEYVSNGNGNGVWKAIATGLGGLVIGLLLAWFTAFQGKGVSQKEMQEYVDKYSPVLPKDITTLSGQIAVMVGKQDRMFESISTLQNNERTDEKEVTEFKTETRKNNEYVANYIEEQRKAKK